MRSSHRGYSMEVRLMTGSTGPITQPYLQDARNVNDVSLWSPTTDVPASHHETLRDITQTKNITQISLPWIPNPQIMR